MGLSSLNTIAVAAATPATGEAAGGMSFIVIIIIMFVAMYFMLIRPQQKRQKQHRALVAALARGDEVITSGGIAGRIEEVGDSFVTVEIASNIKIKLQRSSIAQVLPKGTLKSA